MAAGPHLFTLRDIASIYQVSYPFVTKLARDPNWPIAAVPLNRALGRCAQYRFADLAAFLDGCAVAAGDREQRAA